MTDKKPVIAFSPEDMARRRKRSVILALILVALMILFFVTTVVRLQGNLAERMI